MYAGDAIGGELRFPSPAFTNIEGLEKIEELLEKQQSKDSGFISQLGWDVICYHVLIFVATKQISGSKFDLRYGHSEIIEIIEINHLEAAFTDTTHNGPRLCRQRPNTSDSWTAVGTLLDQETLSIVCREELLGLQMVALYIYIVIFYFLLGIVF